MVSVCQSGQGRPVKIPGVRVVSFAHTLPAAVHAPSAKAEAFAVKEQCCLQDRVRSCFIPAGNGIEVVGSYVVGALRPEVLCGISNGLAVCQDLMPELD